MTFTTGPIADLCRVVGTDAYLNALALMLRRLGWGDAEIQREVAEMREALEGDQQSFAA